MKKILLSIVILLTVYTVNAQKLSTDIYYSVNNQLGAAIYNTTPSGIEYGISGSYLTKSYKGQVFPQYEELANYLLSADAAQWQKPYASAYYNTFIENRGTLKAVLGYDFGNTSIYLQGGVAFRTQYWCGKDGVAATANAEPVHRYFYTYAQIPVAGLYGAAITQKIYKRVGIMIGWNNIEQTTVGIHWTITPTKILNW